MTRRQALYVIALGLGATTRASAFGQDGAFHPRLLRVGAAEPLRGPRATAPGRWSWELIRRTSAPARLVTGEVTAAAPALFAEPVVIWVGEGDFPALGEVERRGLERFLRLGGTLIVDDSDPAGGDFGRAARREVAKMLPDSLVVRLEPTHVLYKSFYLIDRPVGRVEGPPHLEAIATGKTVQVLYLSHDLMGALSRAEGAAWTFDVSGGARQREQAIRLAVNLAMYVLCSDYKDDQVHAEALMRRRGRRGR